MSGSPPNRPLRLLFLQTQAEMAGAQEISRLLGDELSRQETHGEPAFEVHHLFFYRKTSGCDDFPNVRFAATRRPFDLSSGLRLMKNLTKAVREIRPDVLLTFQHYGNVVGAPVGRLLGVPRIIANHVSAPPTINRTVRHIDRMIGLLGGYDTVTVNSQATLRDYSAYPHRYTRRLVHVPHGFALRKALLGKADARRRFDLPQDVKMMGTVARLHPLKQIDLALNVLTVLPDVHLAIAGQGPDRERLIALSNQLGIVGRVHFAGEIPSSDVGDFLSGLDVFVFPSAAETFGLAAVESAQAGIPVVANDLPVLREVLQIDDKPCAAFVDAADTASLSAVIDQLLNDDAKANELSERGRGLAERYSLDAMVATYRQLITQGEQVPSSKFGMGKNEPR